MKIRDRYNGSALDGEFELADDGGTDVECPVCGAMPGQQCSVEDPEREGFSIELCRWVHAERLDVEKP